MELSMLICMLVGAAYIWYRSAMLIIFIVLGKKLKLVVTDKEGQSRSTILKYRPFDSVHRDLLRVKWNRIKAGK